MTDEFVNFNSKTVRTNMKGRWLFLPIGGVEQHGPHLPLHVDTFLANIFCQVLAEKVGGVLAPAIPYGARSLPASGGGDAFPGTIAIPGDTLTSLYKSIIGGFITSGAARIFVLNGHWENEAFLFEAMDQCRQQGVYVSDISVIGLSWWSVLKDKDMSDIFGGFLGWNTEHAAQAETALMLHHAKHTVNMDVAVDHQGHIPNGIYAHPLHHNMRSESGVLGRSRHATDEMGAILSNKVVDGLMSLVNNHPSADDNPK